MSAKNNPPTTVEIKPLDNKISFEMEIPGSKSIATRVLLVAGMAEGASLAAGIPDCEDTRVVMAALEKLGVQTERLDQEMYRIHGCGHDIAGKSGDLDIGSSGAVGRFLPGLLASAPSGEWTLSGQPQLARRPMAPLVDGLRAWGADISSATDGDAFPMTVKGTGLSGGQVEVSAALSTQFASGLLMAGPFARDNAVVRITDLDSEDRYIDTTMGVMRYFGADIEYATSPEALTVTVKAPGGYRAADLRVEADLTAALHFLIMPLLVGGRATVTNVSGDTAQPGNQLLKMFARLRGVVKIGRTDVSVSSNGRQPKGGFEVDMRSMSEMVLAMGVLAIFADEPITMTNIGHIRQQEIDHLAVTADLLGRVGAKVESGPDWIRVHPMTRDEIKNITVDSMGDQRVVMGMSLLGLAGNGITIENAGVVGRTFPDFFERLHQIGAEIGYK